jgi:DNA-binding response OmpR family regulator
MSLNAPEFPNSLPTLRVFVVCDQTDTAPLLGYMIREKGLTAVIETSVQRAMERSTEEVPDLIVIDVNASPAARLALCRKLRALSASPILLFLPAHHEGEILEAYAAGVDECVVKPISPAIFLAKISAWARRSWSMSMRDLKTGRLRLDPARRSAAPDGGREFRLTNLEFRLLQLLMSRPGYTFKADEIIQAVWGGYGQGDETLLKSVVYRLRKKLESESGEADLIQTWPGGYSFRED